MSVIVAILGKGVAVVASDSQRVEADGAIQDDCDKTFAVTSPAIVGAFVGLLEFGGRTVGQHVEDIVAASSSKTLKEATELIGDQMKSRLIAVPECEVGFKHRRVELLVVGKTNLHSGPLEIRSIELRPGNGIKDISVSYGAYSGPGMFAHSGDSDARSYAARRLEMKMKQFPKMTAERLRVEAEKAITTGIVHSGQHPYRPEIKACGGMPRTRTT